MQHSYIHSSGRRLSKLTLTLLLLVTIVGVCSASPLPEKAREDRSGYSDLLSEEYVEKAGKTRTVTQPPSFTHFLTEAFCLSLQPSRCSEKPKNRRPMNFMLGYTWIDGKSTTRVKPNAICRPNYYPLSSPTESYYDSSVVSETSSVYHQNMNMLDAVERLGALSDILRSLARPDRRSKGDYVPVKYRYYFPSPNYFRAFVPTGSKQAQAWISKRDANAFDIIYIPIGIKLEKEAVKKHMKARGSNHHDLSTVAVIAEIGHGLYALLVPNPGDRWFEVGFNFDDTDLPASRWEILTGVREAQKEPVNDDMPNYFY